MKFLWFNSETFPPRNALISVIICTLATSFRLGFNLSVFNPTYAVLQEVMNNTMAEHYGLKDINKDAANFLWSSTTSILFVFAAVGAATFILCSKKVGRRTVILISQLIFILGSVVSAFAYFNLFELVVVGQSLIGFALGFSCSALTPYICEISDDEHSPALYTIVSIVVELGTTTANLIGIDVILGGKDRWPVLFVCPAILNIICIAFFFKSDKETPAQLIKWNKRQEALRSVQFYFQLSEPEAEVKLAQIERKLTDTGGLYQKGIWQALKERANRKAWLMCVLTSTTLNFSGILAITIFGSELMADYGKFDSTINGFVNFGVFTTSLIGLIVSLFTMKNVSHRMLLLLGIPAMFLINVLFMTVMLTLKGAAALISIAILIVLFCMAFSNSIEKVMFFSGSLITLPEYVDANSTVMVFGFYFTGFFSPFIYYPVGEKYGAYSFLMFVVALAFAWICFFVWYPSDKTKSNK